MAELLPEILTKIAELVEPSDLASFRLANTECCEAVNGAAVRLQPSKEIQPAQLGSIHLSFSKATALDLRECSSLNGDALMDLQRLANLRDLQFDTG